LASFSRTIISSHGGLPLKIWLRLAFGRVLLIVGLSKYLVILFR